MAQLIGDIKAAAGKQDDGFVYMNYAGPKQDVFGGYGIESLKRLKKYDSKGLFGELWKGYFKLK